MTDPVPEMVERVAQALNAVKATVMRDKRQEPLLDYLFNFAEGEGVGTWEPSEDLVRLLARAAIEAIREPTEGMIAAARAEVPENAWGGWAEGWRAMVDAMLGKQP